MAMFGGQAKSGQGEGEDFEIQPEGAIPGVLVGMIDLGTQTRTYGGETSESHQVMLVWELTGEPTTKEPTRNHIIGGVYTLSTHEKAKLRISYEKWMGKKFADGEMIDYSARLCHPALLTITHGKTSKDRDYAKLEDFGQLPRGLPAPPAPKTQPFMWSLTDGLYLRNKAKQFEPAMNADLPEWPWLPRVYGEKVHEYIAKSKEWREMMSGSTAKPQRNGKPQEDSGVPFDEPNEVAY